MNFGFKKKKIVSKTYVFLATLLVLFWVAPGFVFASSTEGTVDSDGAGSKYAWSTGIGWINFAPTNGSGNYIGLEITDTAITGYAWSHTYGWINFGRTSDIQVYNTSEGVLSGSAWGENTGWIDFSDVTINGSGRFIGQATGDIVLTVNFDCSTCSVVTDWRMASVRGGGNGGGIPPPPPPEPTPSPVESPLPPPTPTPSPVESPFPSPVESPFPSPVSSPVESPLSSPVPPSFPPSYSPPPVVGDSEGPSGGASSEIENAVSRFIDTLPKGVQVLPRVIKEAINTPVGSVVSKVVTTAGAVVVTAVVFPIAISEMLFAPLRLLGILFIIFGLRKRHKPWGVVYDSVTKRPLDPAYLVLKDENGKEVSSAITDLDGRYGFLVAPGTYTIEAKKSHYRFPSLNLLNRTSDEIYDNLYFGGQIVVETVQEGIIRSIPMDPLEFDWNEFAKSDKKLLGFFSRFDLILRKISEWFFVVGFIVAVLALIFAAQPYNIIIFLIYVFLLLLRIIGLKPKPYGGVIEKSTGNPLSFAIIRIILPGKGLFPDREIARRVADKYGRYYCLVSRGSYYVKIEKKNADGSYLLIYTSPIINTSRKGIIKNIFKI